MSELRIDRLTGRRVLFVSDRVARPRDFSEGDHKAASQEDCPFCEGHEEETPKEVWALRQGPPDAAGWQIRVVPNRYPISEDHELIIETSAHETDISDLPLAHVEEIIRAYRLRMEALSQKERWSYLALFKNHGSSAGASRAHPHAQLVGLPSVPPLIEKELKIAQEFHHERGRCLYCELIERELELKERVIEADEHLIVWSPEAARVPWECWILPRRHQPDFRVLSAQEAAALASALRQTLRRIRRALSEQSYAYNYYVHTAPLLPSGDARSKGVASSYHWHLEIIPRLGRLAGLEWGTELYVNPLLPEEAARRLREFDPHCS